jgi:hypothetical protein
MHICNLGLCPLNERRGKLSRGPTLEWACEESGGYEEYLGGWRVAMGMEVRWAEYEGGKTYLDGRAIFSYMRIRFR